MDSVVIEYRPDPYHAVETAVLDALHGGAERVVLNLDTVDALDNQAVRGLITLLRRSRAVGGELALRSSKPAVLRTLEVTALDRIFPMCDGAAA